MRIALFTGNYNYIREGANQALNRLVAHGERRGHRFRVYSPVTDTPAFEPAGDLVPVPSIALPVRSEFRLALRLPGSIREDVRQFAPDLIHVSTPDFLGTRAQSFAQQLGLPVVASLHTRFETYFRYYGIEWLRPLAEVHLHRFYRRSDHVLAPTPAIIAEMKALRGDDRVSLWSRGVDREMLSPDRRSTEWRRSQGWRDDDVAILFFGRLVLEKGVDEYVEVVRRLRQRGLPVRTLVIGAGPAKSRFQAIPGVTLTGHLDGPDLARAVAGADLLLHPSNTEAFGNVVLEAMASGLAVVSSASDSSKMLIEQGKTGILCPRGDVEAMTNAVARLLHDPAERRRLGRDARNASSAFGWEAASDLVLDAYHQVQATHPTRGARIERADGGKQH